MKQQFKKLLSVLLLLSTAPAIADCVATAFVPRSQDCDKSLYVSGMTEHTHLADIGSSYCSLAVVPEYTRSFNPENITKCFFEPFLVENGDDHTQSVRIQGSAVSGRAANALLADYFYLPSDFDSTISFEPRIINKNVHFDFYVGLDSLIDGLYLRTRGAFSRSEWNMNFQESQTGTPVGIYPQGYFTPGTLNASSLLKDFTAYMNGEAPAATPGSDITGIAGTPFTVSFSPLARSKILTSQEAESGFSGLRTELGWNFVNCDDYHLGLNVQAGAPTGKRPFATFLFSPRIGLPHWELGGGATGHYTFWRSACQDFHIGAYFDVSATHLFRNCENRVFDLKGKPLSRYMLAVAVAPIAVASALNPVGVADLGGLNGATPVPSTYHFVNRYSPVANLTNEFVQISYDVQADVVGWLNMTYRGLSLDAGYNFWMRSKEKYHFGDEAGVGSFPALNGRAWGLKGTAHEFGFAATTEASPNQTTADQNVILMATHSDAQITGYVDNAANAHIDAALPARTGTQLGIAVYTDTSGTTPINTSIEPVLLTKDNLDLSGSRGMSHKVFAHLNYTLDCESWAPYAGVGGFGEFGSHGGCKAETDTATIADNDSSGSRLNCALSQWGVWAKIGISFN